MLKKKKTYAFPFCAASENNCFHMTAGCNIHDTHFEHERSVNGGIVFDVVFLLIELNLVKEQKYLS